jgi:hypothetical protein
MLMESIIGELQASAGRPAGDDGPLRQVLAAGAEAMRGLDDALAGDIDRALADDAGERLPALLERLLIVCEDAAASGEARPALAAARSQAYEHLRAVAGRGWSFWDMLSFRERITRLRRETS